MVLLFVSEYAGDHILRQCDPDLRSTLDVLILRTIATESMHGWGIAQRIQQLSRDALQVGQGSLVG